MTSFILKVIAILSMTVDHCARIIGQAGLMELFPDMPLITAYLLMNLMDAIGRLAFPLFAFMIAEGAVKTRSMPKYIGRLALFAVISEPVFYYVNNIQTASLADFLRHLSGFNLSNVFFTLALGAAAIYIYQLLDCQKSKKRLLFFIPALFMILFVGGYIRCDYGIAGILLIVALFLAKTKLQKTIVISIWSIGLYIVYRGMGDWSQAWTFPILNCICAMLSSAFIWSYNGKRGKPIKWFFYIYYPAHFLVLAFLRSIIR